LGLPQLLLQAASLRDVESSPEQPIDASVRSSLDRSLAEDPSDRPVGPDHSVLQVRIVAAFDGDSK
jgi:hypothetical protein